MLLSIKKHIMTINKANRSPHYYNMYLLRWIIIAIRFIFVGSYFLLRPIIFVLGIARDWIIHFMLIRMIIFPFTYWRRYRYEVDKDGWSVRKRRNRRAPLSCECKMKIIPWQMKMLDALENILGFDLYYDLTHLRLIIEVRINARRKKIEEVAFKTVSPQNGRVIESQFFSDKTLSKIEHWVRMSYIGCSSRRVAMVTRDYSKLYIYHDFAEVPDLGSLPPNSYCI